MTTPHPKPHPFWLWWLALLTLLSGGVIAYMLSLDKINATAQTAMRLTIMASIVIAGIFIISACASWLVKR